MARRVESRDADRATWGFAELFRWHLNRGTRPGRGRIVNKPWTVKEFADAARISDRTVRNWLTGKVLPSNIMLIDAALFGRDSSLTDMQIEMRDAYYKSSQIHTESDVKEKYNERNIIDTFQQFNVLTPLNNNYSLFSLSIVIGSRANRVASIDVLTQRKIKSLNLSVADSVSDFIDSIIVDIPEFLYDQSREALIDAIDVKFGILYAGSINPVTTNQLAKLPTLIKGFASLSDRQFKVGLFRLSTTIVVVTVVSGGAAVGAKVLYDVASLCVSELTHSIHQK